MDALRFSVSVRHALFVTTLAASCLGVRVARGADDIEPIDPAPPEAIYALDAGSTEMFVRARFNNRVAPGRVEVFNKNNKQIEIQMESSVEYTNKFGYYHLFIINLTEMDSAILMKIYGVRIPPGDGPDEREPISKTFDVELRWPD